MPGGDRDSSALPVVDRLRNGTISGFTSSVDLTGSAGVLVEDLPGSFEI
jgi:hypothetical protein